MPNMRSARRMVREVICCGVVLVLASCTPSSSPRSSTRPAAKSAPSVEAKPYNRPSDPVALFGEARRNGDLHAMGDAVDRLVQRGLIHQAMKQEDLAKLLGEFQGLTGIYMPDGHSCGYAKAGTDSMDYEAFYWFHFNESGLKGWWHNFPSDTPR